MKILLLDMYKIVYRITNKSTLAIIVSLSYITLLNMAMLYGLGLLLTGYSFAKVLVILTRFPFYIGTAVLMFLINRAILAPFKNIKKEKNKPINYGGLIIYTVVALIIYAYSKYGNMIF